MNTVIETKNDSDQKKNRPKENKQNKKYYHRQNKW